jgi:hypothetical protein
MIGKLLNMLGMVALASGFSLGGFVGYLFVTGKLNGAKMELIARVLRDEPHASPAATQPAASQPAMGDSAPRQQSADEVRVARRQAQLQRAALERAARDVQARQDLLEQAMADMIARSERFEANKEAWLSQRQKMSESLRDQGFRKEVEFVNRLPAEVAKQHIVRVWQKSQPDAVRLFNALDASRGKAILEELKTPEEMELMTGLLEQIRRQDELEPMSGSGKTSGDSK